MELDATIITVLSTAAAISTVIWLTTSSLGKRIDALIHANQQAHDTIGLRIDNQGAELGGRIDAHGKELRERIDAQGKELRARIDAQREELCARIDAQGAELGGRIDALEVRLARTSEDVSFIKGRLTADGTG